MVGFASLSFALPHSQGFVDIPLSSSRISRKRALCNGFGEALVNSFAKAATEFCVPQDGEVSDLWTYHRDS